MVRLLTLLCTVFIAALAIGCKATDPDPMGQGRVTLWVADEGVAVELDATLLDVDEDTLELFEDDPETPAREDSILYMSSHTGLEDDPDTARREDLVPPRLRDQRANLLRKLRRTQRREELGY